MLQNTTHSNKNYKEERFALAPTITFLPNEQTRLTLLPYSARAEVGINFTLRKLLKVPQQVLFPLDFNVKSLITITMASTIWYRL